MRLSYLRLVLPVLLLAASVVAFPVDAQPPGLTVSDHSLIYAHATNGVAGVREVLEVVNGASDPYEGDLSFSLSTGAKSVQAILERGATAVPVPSDQFTNSTADGFTTFRFNLKAQNVTIASGSSLRLHLFYAAPGDAADRRFDLPTERFLASFVLTAGKAPEATGMQVIHWPSRGIFTTLPDEGKDRNAGDRFAFTVKTLDKALEPVAITVRASGKDTLTLTAMASAGVLPYRYAWDTDGDGTFETTGDKVTVGEGVKTYTVRVLDGQSPAVAATTTYTVNTRAGPATDGEPLPAPKTTTDWTVMILAALFGALVMYGLSAGGLVPGRASRAPTTPTGGRTIAVETKDMLELRKRTQVAALKELELAKKKGEVPDGLYLPLKEELKGETVKVMRELERREKETV